MFPNLRLLLGASLATVLLIAIVGAGLFALPDLRGRTEVAQISRPLMQQPVADDLRQPFGLGAIALRNGELQRLLALPSTPVRAYAPEPGAGFPYEFGPRDTSIADTLTDEAEAAPQRTSAAPPLAMPDSPAAAPAEGLAPPDPSKLAALPEPDPPMVDPVPAVTEPAAAVEPMQPTEPKISSASANDNPVESADRPVAPAPAPTVDAATSDPTTTSSITSALPTGEPITEVDLAAPGDGEDMPLPRPKPGLAPAAAAKGVAPVRLRQVKVTASQPRRIVRRAPRPLPAPVQAFPFPFYDTGFNDQYDAEGRRIDAVGAHAATVVRSHAEMARTAAGSTGASR